MGNTSELRSANIIALDPCKDYTEDQLWDRILLLENIIGSGYTSKKRWMMTPAEKFLFEALKEDMILTYEGYNMLLLVAGKKEVTHGCMSVRMTAIRKRLRDAGAPFEVIVHHGMGWTLRHLDD